MSISIFISTVTAEFRLYRDQLRHDLTRHNVDVKVQEDFKDTGGDTLDSLDTFIAHCDGVVHLIGDMTGFGADEHEQQSIIGKHANLLQQLPPLGDALKKGLTISYTQWEAWLALYHRKPLLIAKAGAIAPRGPNYAPTAHSRDAQSAHLARLETVRRLPRCEFADANELAKHIAYTTILDLLVRDYAEKVARERDVARGFIYEMANRVAGDAGLDFDGMKEAVRNAIDIYEKEVAGQLGHTNNEIIVGDALEKARVQFDGGHSGLARATLRRAVEKMRREERNRHEDYVEGATALLKRERDFALASYDGEGAARATVLLAETVCRSGEAATIATYLEAEANAIETHGHERRSKVHLAAAIALRSRLLALAATDDESGTAGNNLGVALARLGELESGTTRLERAVAAFRSALEKLQRDRVPVIWAIVQANLGRALLNFGARESQVARVEEALIAFRLAQEELTRERDLPGWAIAQRGLGDALRVLGERELGTALLEEAVEAYRAALELLPRRQLPVDWAITQNNLGNALQAIGERESGPTRLEQAAAAYRAALEERTRERFPFDWATTQNNLGLALGTLGEREGSIARLGEAVQACRAALEEFTPAKAPLSWAASQNNLGNALQAIGELENGTAGYEAAVQAYRSALQEFTREGLPLAWAAVHNNLGTALQAIGERESGTARLQEALAAYFSVLTVRTRERLPHQWAGTRSNIGVVLRTLADRLNDGALLEDALACMREALEVFEKGQERHWPPILKRRITEMQLELELAASQLAKSQATD
jgi:tetratricopeptide (TPR) repeat protein